MKGEIAGNIIPAIATTNAIIGGMITLQAIKVLNGQVKDCNDVNAYEERNLTKVIFCLWPETAKLFCY